MFKHKNLKQNNQNVMVAKTMISVHVFSFLGRQEYSKTQEALSVQILSTNIPYY